MPDGTMAYRTSLRASVRALWSGTIDFDQAWETMSSAVRRRLTQAWHEGAAECGVAPEDFSPAEQIELQNAIVQELQHVAGLLDGVMANRKDRGGKLSPLLLRVEGWLQRYSDVKSRARVMTCADQKLEWVLGETKEHCTSCLKLAGKVKRGSYWLRMGVHPQRPPNQNLECDGWGQCQLLPTDRPISRGPLPRLP